MLGVSIWGEGGLSAMAGLGLHVPWLLAPTGTAILPLPQPAFPVGMDLEFIALGAPNLDDFVTLPLNSRSCAIYSLGTTTHRLRSSSSLWFMFRIL